MKTVEKYGLKATNEQDKKDPFQLTIPVTGLDHSYVMHFFKETEDRKAAEFYLRFFDKQLKDEFLYIDTISLDRSQLIKYNSLFSNLSIVEVEEKNGKPEIRHHYDAIPSRIVNTWEAKEGNNTLFIEIPWQAISDEVDESFISVDHINQRVSLINDNKEILINSLDNNLIELLDSDYQKIIIVEKYPDGTTLKYQSVYAKDFSQAH